LLEENEEFDETEDIDENNNIPIINTIVRRSIFKSSQNN
jgi:hypothetical protein